MSIHLKKHSFCEHKKKIIGLLFSTYFPKKEKGILFF